MSADPQKLQDSFADQLASFDDRLRATVDDVEMLADIQDGIGQLLASSGNSEAQIRRILQERYESGSLRKETFQLVKSLLDRHVNERFASENVPTSPTATTAPPIDPPGSEHVPDAAANTDEDTFGATTVIPGNVFTPKSAEGRVQVGSLLRDRFLLQEKVSGGSMGVVYKAMDRRLAEAGTKDHWVAIKVLSPQLAESGQALRALQQEAAKGRCLSHPNIVQFVDLDRDDDLYFLVMEWLEGRSLAEILDSKDAAVIDTKAAFHIVHQIGAALEYAHSRGIVHADVKPGNIMVMPNGDAKLFDFGVARVRQQHTDSHFDPGVLGALTPAYSSMQVLTGEDPVAADDVFSLACLLYRLIAGYRVFGPRNAAEAADEGMKPQRLKEFNDNQWRAMKKALAYSRVARFASVKEFTAALEQDSNEPFRVEQPDRLLDLGETAGSGRWLWALLIVAIAALGAAYQTGYLAPIIEKARTLVSSTESDQPFIEVAVPVNTGTVDEESVASDSDAQTEPADAVAGSDVSAVLAESAATDGSAGTVDPADPDGDGIEAVELSETFAADVYAKDVAGPASMLVDFSALPPPTDVISFTPGQTIERPVTVAVREDGPDLVLDFVRGSGLSEAMTLRLEEVGFTGNRSPWGAGQYALSNAGLIHFPVGQARGRVTITMATDPRQEPDQTSILRLRQADFADSELVTINLTLEDDDRRRFAAQVPGNTIAFATPRKSVAETDPAVQLDLIRYSPDDTAVLVPYTVTDITATEGTDYFAPGSYTVSFGPQQRSARLLIPLVQDSEVEGEETFVVSIQPGPGFAINSNNEAVIVIRDEDPQAQ